MSLKGLRSHSPLAIRTDYSMLELVLFYDTQSVWHPSYLFSLGCQSFSATLAKSFPVLFYNERVTGRNISKAKGLAYNNNEIFLSLGS